MKTELKDFKVILTNTQGQVLIDQMNTSEINVSGIPSGIYFMTLQNENGTAVKRKLIITKM